MKITVGNFSYDDGDGLGKTEMLRLAEVKSAFQNEEFMTRFHTVVQNTKASFRVVDYLCVHYSKLNNVQYIVKYADGHETHFDLHLSYLRWQDRWKKRMFDIFRRTTPITYEYGGVAYRTTVAQVNYVYWMLLHSVDVYLENHLAEILQHKTTTLHAARKNKGLQRKRITPTRKPTALCIVAEESNVVFDRLGV